MFDGQPDMWLALRAACTHAESGDWQMAQAIVDGAGLVCVDGRLMLDAHTCEPMDVGTLETVYDERGTRYDVPLYCLCKPINIRPTATASGRRKKRRSQYIATSPDDDNDKSTTAVLHLRHALNATVCARVRVCIHACTHRKCR